MPYEMKEGTFSLFVNNRKTKQMHPDRTGKIRLNGKTYFLSGWMRETKDGSKYMSGTVKEDPRGGGSDEDPNW